MRGKQQSAQRSARDALDERIVIFVTEEKFAVLQQISIGCLSEGIYRIPCNHAVLPGSECALFPRVKAPACHTCNKLQHKP